MTDSEQIREFFHRMANGMVIGANSESSRNSRSAHTTNGTFALFESESESIDLVKPLSVGSDQSVLSLRAYT